MTRLPDFILIGAMKCATTTLHNQLAEHPGIGMAEPKEPCFFSDDEVWERGFGWYETVFGSASADDLLGESSTHYTKLPTYPQTVARLREHVPDARLIYVIRHPIDRLISQYIHEWTERVTSDPIDEAIQTLPELIDYSRYAYQIRPYLQAFGPDRVLLVFQERLAIDGQGVLESVARHIGYDRPVRWNDEIMSNKSAERMRVNPLRDALVWNPVSNLIRKRIPQSFRDRVKTFWQMTRRPELSADSVRHLTSVFDRDLEELGRWLGVELNCQNFKQVARNLRPQWQAVASTL